MEKTIKEVIEKVHNVYKGKFWNRHIKEFQSWNEHTQWLKAFDQFCDRMWLDNEDETLSPPASVNRLSKADYVHKYEKWLVQQFLIKQVVDRSII